MSPNKERMIEYKVHNKIFTLNKKTFIPIYLSKDMLQMNIETYRVEDRP